MGNIELHYGDCIDILWEKNKYYDSIYKPFLIPDKSVDCIIDDLPYFQVVDADWDNGWIDVYEYIEWVEEIIQPCTRVLRENANIILFTGRQYNWYVCQMLDKYFDEKRIIIWSRKRGFNNTRGKALASGYEPICYYSRGDNPVFNNVKIKPITDRKEYTEGILKEGITLSDVWSDIPALPHNSKEKVNHPTQKPLKLMERIVSLFTNEDETVLDFCMGSGTTGVACKNLNRNFIGIEKNKEYFDIAQERLCTQQEKT